MRIIGLFLVLLFAAASAYGVAQGCVDDDNDGYCVNIDFPPDGYILEDQSNFDIEWSQQNIDMVTIGYKTCPSCLDWIVYNLMLNKSSSEGRYTWKMPASLGGRENVSIQIIAYNRGVGSETDTVTFSVSATCADSDQALDIYTLGTVKSGQQVFYDSCSGTGVKQYYCDGNGIARYSISDCPSGCSNGACKRSCTESWQCTAWSACSNGQQTRACTDTNACGTTSFKPATSQSCQCIDTDGGRNYYVRSTIGSQSWNGTEQCQGNYIFENYCNDAGNLIQETYICPNGCADGACIPYKCTDSDGRNKDLKGNVVYAGRTFTDYCKDAFTVNEYVCMKDSGTDVSATDVVSYVSEACQYGCSDGFCKVPTACNYAAGDANGDGRLDCKDYVGIRNATLSSAYLCGADCNQDGKVDVSDMVCLRNRIQRSDGCLCEKGDANMDGYINLDDITATQNMLGNYLCEADCNSDSKVDSTDYICIRNKLSPCNSQAGDANSDGLVTVRDIAVVRGYMGGNTSFSCGMDCNKDGNVDITDIACIQNKLNCVPGDANSDGSLTGADLTSLNYYLTNGGEYRCGMDCNQDGTVSAADINCIKSKLTCVPGDANGDGQVSASDITLVRNYMGGQGNLTCGMDCNQDGNVDVTDMSCIQNRFYYNCSYQKGDANHDGTVNSADQLSVHTLMYANAYDCAADCSGDGWVNNLDVPCIMEKDMCRWQKGDANHDGMISTDDAYVIRNLTLSKTYDCGADCSGDGIVDYSDSGCLQTKLPVCGNGICEQGENCPADCQTSADLKDYPALFIRDGQFNGLLVVGKNAPASDTIAMTNIALGIQAASKTCTVICENTQSIVCGTGTTCTPDSQGCVTKCLINPIPVTVNKFDTEVSDYNQNLIAVGNPCNNMVTKKIIGSSECDAQLGGAAGIILLKSTGMYSHLAVYGRTNEDMQAVSKVLQNYGQYGLKGSTYYYDVVGCRDTDSGADYFTKGTLTFNNYIAVDTCRNIYSTASSEDSSSCDGSQCYVMEGICDATNSDFRITAYNCQYGCRDGACLKSACSDSDSGINYLLRGETKDIENGGVYYDYCSNTPSTCPGCASRGNYLVEWYCRNGSVANDIHLCADGCNNGICGNVLSPCANISSAYLCADREDCWWDEEYSVCHSGQDAFTCYDPDGENTQVRSTAYGLLPDAAGSQLRTRFAMRDSCAGKSVYEYYCQGQNVMAKTIPCENGCEEGVCVGDFDLSDYPQMFIDNGKFDAVLVVGKMAAATDTIALTNVALGLQKLGYTVLATQNKFDSEITDLDQNIISIGGPCVNSVTAAMAGNPEICYTGAVAGKARILLQNSGGKYQLAIYGGSAAGSDIAMYGNREDTVLASRLFQCPENAGLKGMDMTVSTASIPSCDTKPDPANLVWLAVGDKYPYYGGTIGLEQVRFTSGGAECLVTISLGDMASTKWLGLNGSYDDHGIIVQLLDTSQTPACKLSITGAPDTGSCSVNADCEDNDASTPDYCLSGRCVHQDVCIANDGLCPASCNFATDSDCAQCIADSDCQDDDSCNTDMCRNGRCEHTEDVGCQVGRECIPIGTRYGTEYCGLQGLTEQFEGGVSCENNFECSSNICADGECVSQGMFKRFMSWLRRFWR